MPQTSDFHSRLIGGEIQRIVARFVATGHILSAPEAAAEILNAHPDCGLKLEQLAHKITVAAAAAGVSVMVGRFAGG